MSGKQKRAKIYVQNRMERHLRKEQDTANRVSAVNNKTMKANYHTHTIRCRHASGSEREYVENAIEGGLEILGFSDHSPYPFPKGYESGFRMRLDEFEGYVDTVLALKKEYKNDIEIHLGLETEYYPAYFEDLRSFLKPYPVEYFILGQHMLKNEIDGVGSGWETNDEAILLGYCSQSAEALKTGCFSYFAHPDLINFKGNPDLYEKEMRKLCKTAKECKTPLEINFLGLTEQRHYPNQFFWKIVGEEGNEVVFGSDAHKPSAVWNPSALKMANEMVKKYNLNLVETITFKKPV